MYATLYTADASYPGLQLFARSFEFGGQDFFIWQGGEVLADKHFVREGVGGVTHQRFTLAGTEANSRDFRDSVSEIGRTSAGKEEIRDTVSDFADRNHR